MSLYRWGVIVGSYKTYVQVCLHKGFVQFKLFGVYRLYRVRLQSPITIKSE